VATLAKQDLVGFLFSALVIALAATGMGGAAYHCLAPDGLVAAWLGRIWSQGPVLGVLVTVGLLSIGLALRNGMGTGRARATDVPLYLFVALGAFFASRLVVSGSL
jgi:hypothetical protein